MTLKHISKKTLKAVSILVGGLMLLIVLFHLWLINHAEDILEELVSTQSSGKLRLDVSRFRFNWLNRNMELRRAVFYSNDTTASTAYQFRVEKMRIRLKAILPLMLDGVILIDSLHLMNPDIRVTRLRSSTRDSLIEPTASLSLPQEMGRIYNSIQDALKVLNVTRFQIDNGRFSLINKIRPDEPPVVITNIHLHLDNLQVDSTKPGASQKILFSDNVALHTRNQDILFPDGRHRLSFRNFRINIRNRFVEFDSCTVRASRGDGAKNSFSIFFDKLRMTNIDFATLYRQEIIKADSVYCINPRFRLDVDLEKKSEPVKGLPKLDEMIRQLTGDMELAFVVVENGSFDINTVREGRPSSFTSDHNNFELQGLEIKKDAPRPLVVEKFVMAIRHSENFFRDSAFSIQFDSILIHNDRVSLSNFFYEELEKPGLPNQLGMPQFELRGLSWDDLVFNRNLAADRVTLYKPIINYDVSQNDRLGSKDIFQTLAGIGSIMQLENLAIRDGQINLFFRNDVSLQLQNASMTVMAKQLVNSRGLEHIQRSVNDLYFEKGKLKTGNLAADFSGVSVTGKHSKRIHADQMNLSSSNGLEISASGAEIDSLLVNNKGKQTILDGISWNEASIHIAGTSLKQEKGIPDMVLKNVHGSRTNIQTVGPGKSISLFLQQLDAKEITASPGGQWKVDGLNTAGSNLRIQDRESNLEVEAFQLHDHQPSYLRQISYSAKHGVDSISLRIPRFDLVPDVNELLKGTIQSPKASISQPEIFLTTLKNTSTAEGNNAISWPVSRIDKLVVEKPSVHFARTADHGTITVSWSGDENRLEFSNLRISRQTVPFFTADQIDLVMHHFLFKNADGKIFDTRNGRLNIQLEQVNMHRGDGSDMEWSGKIRNLEARNFIIDSLGKNGGRLNLDHVNLRDFFVMSSNLPNLKQMIGKNSAFRLENISGSYRNQHDEFKWYNTSYDRASRHIRADSLTYQPAVDLKTFLDAKKYQTDFVTARLGKISIGPFDLSRLLQDSIYDIGKLLAEDGCFSFYRDKRKPIKPGTIRPLPVNLVKKIPAMLTLDSLLLRNSTIEYTEFNPKTQQTGTVLITGLNALVNGIQNHQLDNRDSLRIAATGRIADEIPTRLEVIESYADKQGAFHMTVKMGAADITKLNPMLKPLAAAELNSGYLDTLEMQVAGREELAFGKIKMLYLNLKVTAIKKRNGSASSRPVLRNFFLNTFIKNNNQQKTHSLFFRRLRERSAINYLVKITLNGVLNTVTGRQPRRDFRRHKQEIRKTKLPPVR